VVIVIDFVQKQLEVSQQLLSAMALDQQERLEGFTALGEINANLIKKLAERDKIIVELRSRLQAYEAVEAR
jgi:hypothetical protein